MKTKTIIRDKVNVITLGCSKNLVDSENLITQLKANDIDVEHESQNDANIIIVNTCGFIDLAKEESINTIVEYADIKAKGGIDKLYVTGCLSQRYKDDLEKEIPEVDAFFGTLELPGLLARLNADYKHELIGERSLTTPQHFAYMKISEGCNRIGVKELVLIAQELTYYGLDLYKKRALSELLDALCEVDGIEWIRLHYAYPGKFPLEVFDTMAKQPKVCNYLDIPLQHASDTVLDRMKRQTTCEEQRSLIQHARNRVPDIAIRTTFLVGFPGESEDEFQQLCDFIDVDAVTKVARANKIMELQQSISLDHNQEKIGQTLRVLFDRKEGEYFIGRTEYDSPEVDNEVLVPAKDYFVRIGDFALVEITDAEDYDLYGKVVETPIVNS